MEKFRKSLVKRKSKNIALLLAIICVFAGACIIHRIFDVALSDDILQAFSIGFSVGIFITSLSLLVKEIIDYNKALNSEDKLRYIYSI